MFLNLKKLGDEVGDSAISFIPRTWAPAQLRAEEREAAAAGGEEGRVLRGLWVHKDPHKALGSGIRLVRDVDPARLAECASCVLQRYVADPFLLDGRKKFSFGVYTAVSSRLVRARATREARFLGGP